VACGAGEVGFEVGVLVLEVCSLAFEDGRQDLEFGSDLSLPGLVAGVEQFTW
jgi:hypothetical protein